MYNIFHPVKNGLITYLHSTAIYSYCCMTLEIFKIKLIFSHFSATEFQPNWLKEFFKDIFHFPMLIVNTKNRNMPHPLHHSKINGKMNLPSFKTLFNISLNIKEVLFLLFLLGTQFSINAQSIIPKDTISVVIPTNDNKAIVTGQQLHDELNPSGLLFFDNIDAVDVNGMVTQRDTNWIPDDDTPILYIGCDTNSVYEYDSMADSMFYGIEKRLDTLANFTEVTFFSYFDGPTRQNQQLRLGSGTHTAIPLSGTGTSITTVFRVIDNTPPIALCKRGPLTVSIGFPRNDYS